MKLRLALGRAGTGKTRLCLDEIAERLRAAPEGRPLVLLVPEHATFQMERELAAAEGVKGFSRAYVVGFRRLAHKVLTETGGVLSPYITELGKKLVLSRLMQENQSRLKVFGRAVGQRNFADTLAGMIKELKTYAVSADKLIAAQDRLETMPPLADKLHDLGILYREFQLFLENRYTDTEDYLHIVSGKISDSSLLRNAEIWVDGFVWFNPREFIVLAEIFKTAGAVTVTLCLDNPDSPEHSSQTALFHRQWNTRRKLLELAAAEGIAVQEDQLQTGYRMAERPILRYLESQVFCYPAAPWRGSREGLDIVEAANRRVEVEGMACDMIRRCREEGCRWRDMAVLLRDVESYAALVETVLTDYDIPFFSDGKRQPAHHPLAELLRSAPAVINGEWNYDPLFRCLKTDLFPLSRDEIDELENYVLAFGIRGWRWTSGQDWTYVRCLSLNEDSDISVGQQADLHRINGIRRRAVAPLAALQEQMRQSATVADKTTALYAFLEELAVPARLEEWAQKADADGELEQAREHRQIWGAICELFDQLVETCGEQELTLADYVEMIHDGLESLQISLIPPGLDYVAVSSLVGSSVANLPSVYVLGVNDGILPMRGRGEGLVSDVERSRLAEVGVELAPGAAADSFAERFLAYLALTRSSRSIWISYPLADEEGKGLNPSLLIKRLRDLTGAGIRSLPLEAEPGREKEYLAHPRRSLSALAVSLRLCRGGEEVNPVWWDVYNWARRQADLQQALRQALAGLFHSNRAENLSGGLPESLYLRRETLSGSVTRFENFQACPFRHFLQYGLGLKERTIFRLEAPDMGQFLHAALKEFGEVVLASGRAWGSFSPDECRRLCREITEKLAPRLQNEILLSSGQHQHIMERLRRTMERSVIRLAEYDTASSFKPVALEKAFGEGELPPLAYQLADGRKLELRGQIDRIDCAEHQGATYMLIMDYKSGGAWLRLPEVYYGLKLQLLTYLLAAQKLSVPLLGEKNCLPAGVLYFFLKNPSLTGEGRLSAEEIQHKINSQLKMPGWTLHEPDIIRLLDAQMESRSEFLKIALKKDNTLYRTSLPYVKSADEFALLTRHTEKTLVTTAEKIIGGEIGITPFSLQEQQACRYCHYFPVCQFDKQLTENDYRKLAPLSDEAVLKALTRGEGEET